MPQTPSSSRVRSLLVFLFLRVCFSVYLLKMFSYVLLDHHIRRSGWLFYFKGIAKGGAKTHNKGGVSVCLRLSTFARVCLRLLAFSPLRLLAFVCVCLRLFAFARICLRPPLLRPPLRDTDICFIFVRSVVLLLFFFLFLWFFRCFFFGCFVWSGCSRFATFAR